MQKEEETRKRLVQRTSGEKEAKCRTKEKKEQERRKRDLEREAAQDVQSPHPRNP